VGGASGRAREHRGVVVELVDEKAAPERDPRPMMGRCLGGGRTQRCSMLRGAPQLLVLGWRTGDGAAALGA
jgi:hypothetical protein